MSAASVVSSNNNVVAVAYKRGRKLVWGAMSFGRVHRWHGYMRYYGQYHNAATGQLLETWQRELRANKQLDVKPESLLGWHDRLARQASELPASKY